jgi:uncharacterized membrane protein
VCDAFVVGEADEGEPSDQRAVSFRTSRMEAFSDGVYAIAITLLVLDIAVPGPAERHLLRALGHEWPIYLAYVVSFASIGSSWLAHTVITEYLERADSILLRLNLLLLFFVSVLPFPTHLLSNYLHSPNAERVAVTVYGLNLLAIAGFTSVMWHDAQTEGLTTAPTDAGDLRALQSKVEPSLISYLVAIAIGLALPRAAVVLYLLIAL